ncbi:VOC family protein [Octadecabacter temperatus]
MNFVRGSTEEIPSSCFQRTAAVLQVNSRTVRPMRDFFVERLGFELGTEIGTGPKFVTLDRDGQTIMLACHRTLGFRKHGWAAYFWVENIEALHDEFERRGAKLKSPITDKPYGCREIVAMAPDGREIVFGEITGTQAD